MTSTDAGDRPGRVQRRRDRHHTRILDVAEEMFAGAHYSAVRIDEVAERADVSVGTVYTHFGNKDGLVHHVAERVLDRAQTFVLERVEAAGDRPVDRFIATGAACFELLVQWPSLARFLLTPTVPNSAETAARIKARVATLYDALAAVITSCIETGDIADDVDAYRLAAFLISSWCGVIIATTSALTPPADVDEARAAIEQASQALLYGLLRRKA